MSIAVFPDTTVFCNFAAVGRSDLLGEFLRGRGRWTEAVHSEVETSRGYLPDLKNVLSGGWMGEVVEVSSADEIRQVELIRRNVFGGDLQQRTKHLGEAMTCHVVRTRPEFKGAWWVTDDTEALRYARRQGITTMETIDLFQHAVADFDITARAAFDLMHAMAAADRSLRLPTTPSDLA